MFIVSEVFMLATIAQGPFTGNSRSSYGTSSQGLVAIAEARLRASRLAALQGVSCSFDGGILTLHGVVASYHLKQLAQTIVRNLDDVSQVENRILVGSSVIE
jgi:osmotically-inducible protein OsmY